MAPPVSAEDRFDQLLDSYVEKAPAAQGSFDSLTDRIAALPSDEARIEVYVQFLLMIDERDNAPRLEAEEAFTVALYGTVDLASLGEQGGALASATLGGAKAPSVLAFAKAAATHARAVREATDAPGDEDEDEEAQCTICCDAPRSVRFRPCHHSIMCDGCLLRLIGHSKNKKLVCPSCNQTIERISGDEPSDELLLRPVRKGTYEPPKALREALEGAGGPSGAEAADAAADGASVSEYIRAQLASRADGAVEADHAWHRSAIEIHGAIEEDDLVEARALWARGASVSQANEAGELPLVIACVNGNLEMAQWLHSEGASVHEPDAEGDRPMHAAAMALALDVCRWLKEQGAAVNERNEAGQTPMLLAAESHEDDDEDEDDDDDDDDDDGENDDEENARVRERAERRRARAERRAERHAAEEAKKLALCEWLLAEGSSVSEADGDGQTPLHGACASGCVGLARWLLTKGADLESAAEGLDGATPLHEACLNGRLELIKMLQQAGANMRACGNQQQDAVMVAAREGHVEIVRYLIEVCGLDLESTDVDGETPVHGAATEGYLDVIKYLHSAGASIEVADDDGDTPMHSACCCGHLQVAKWLVAHGAPADRPNSAGYAPIHVLLLAEAVDDDDDDDESDDEGSDDESDDEDEDEEATRERRRRRRVAKLLPVLIWLCEQGGRATRTSDGKTPLELAEAAKATDFASFLRDLSDEEDASATRAAASRSAPQPILEECD